jgi:hypothetical protein
MIELRAPLTPQNFDLKVRAWLETAKAFESAVTQLPVCASLDDEATRTLLTPLERCQEQIESFAKHCEPPISHPEASMACLTEHVKLAEQMASQFSAEEILRKLSRDLVPQRELLLGLSANFRSPREGQIVREKEIIRKVKTNNYVYFISSPAGTQPHRFETTKQNQFIRKGAVWLLGINGEVRPAKDQKGLEYIAYVLARPGRSLIHIDVFDDLNGRNEFEATAGDDPRADHETIRSIRARYDRLRDELESAEEDGLTEQAEEYREEMRRLGEYLSSVVGYGGHSRLLPDRDRRAKESVTRAIRRTLKDLKSIHPSLHSHLKKYLRLNPLLIYQPDTPVDWEL